MERTLSAKEVLAKACEKLGERSSRSIAPIGLNAMAVMANDSDWHRTREGSMRYDRGNFMEIDGNLWLFSVGTKCGSYPGSQFAADLIGVLIKADSSNNASAVERLKEYRAPYVRVSSTVIFSDEDLKIISGYIARGTYFRNSLVVASDDGRFVWGPPGGIYSPMMEKALIGRLDLLSRHIAQEARRDSEYLSINTGNPVVIAQARYRPEAADVFVEAILESLGEFLARSLKP